MCQVRSTRREAWYRNVDESRFVFAGMKRGLGERRFGTAQRSASPEWWDWPAEALALGALATLALSTATRGPTRGSQRKRSSADSPAKIRQSLVRPSGNESVRSSAADELQDAITTLDLRTLSGSTLAKSKRSRVTISARAARSEGCVRPG